MEQPTLFINAFRYAMFGAVCLFILYFWGLYSYFVYVSIKQIKEWKKRKNDGKEREDKSLERLLELGGLFGALVLGTSMVGMLALGIMGWVKS